jgi:hypothetical protein
LQNRLRVAYAYIDQSDFEAPLTAHAGGRAAAVLPVVFDSQLVERGLQRRLQLLASDDQDT